MDFAFLLKNLLGRLLLPPFSLVLATIAGLLMAERRPRLGWALAWAGILGMLLLATPFVSRLLVRSVSVDSRMDAVSWQSAQTVVILGGGVRLGTPEYGDTLSRLTMDRVRYGASVARRTGLPILVTGGALFGAPPEAQIMATTLREEFILPVRFVEAKARDTQENLKYSAAMLKPEGISKVVLVTHDYHMQRALAYCAAAGLVCLPAPVSLQGAARAWLGELPSARALYDSVLALHEVLGLLAMRLGVLTGA